MDENKNWGTLYIVATPLGNLEDITFRAVNVLKQVDLIAAEDTRHSKKLLLHYNIPTKLISCHEHNEIDVSAKLIDQLKSGVDIALISDAGTPLISDPGYNLVLFAAKENIDIIPVPGCSAVIAGLSVAGLPTDSFLFVGFLPKKKQKLKQSLENLKYESATLILYESPKRIINLVEIIIEIFGDRNACLAREITKLHEEYIRGSLSTILSALENKETIKGEISLFITGSNQKEKGIDDKQLKAIIQKKLKTTDLGTSLLAKNISTEYNISKKHVYDMILKLI